MSIPAGIYKGRAVEGSEQYGQTSQGNDQIVLDLDLDSGDRVSTFLVFSDKAAQYSMQRLRKLGWAGTDLANLVGIDSNEVDVEIKYEEYNGEQKMKVNIVAGGTVTLERPFDDKSKKAFAAKYANMARATAPKAGAAPQRVPTPTRQAPTQATGTDDEIPF